MIETVKRWVALLMLAWLFIFFVVNSILLCIGNQHLGFIAWIPCIFIIYAMRRIHKNWW